MRAHLAVISVAALAGALALLSAPAGAQEGACAPDDVKCRLATLEARVGALEGKQSKIEVRQAQAEAANDEPANLIKSYALCRSNCQEEADALCKAKGYAGGRAKTFERPKTGPTILKLAECAAP
jgi:hypothetical protein